MNSRAKVEGRPREAGKDVIVCSVMARFTRATHDGRIESLTAESCRVFSTASPLSFCAKLQRLAQCVCAMNAA